MKINDLVCLDLLKCKSGKILDIGCGQAEILNRLNMIGFEIFGLDKNEVYGNISFKKFDLNSMKKLPYKNNTFDYIVCTEVLGYLDNPVFVLKEMNRILKKGGRLFLTTPGVENIYSKYLFLFKNRFMHFFDDIENPQTHPLLLRSLRYYLEEVGFKILRIRDKFFSKDSLYIKAKK